MSLPWATWTVMLSRTCQGGVADPPRAALHGPGLGSGWAGSGGATTGPGRVGRRDRLVDCVLCQPPLWAAIETLDNDVAARVPAPPLTGSGDQGGARRGEDG